MLIWVAHLFILLCDTLWCPVHRLHIAVSQGTCPSDLHRQHQTCCNLPGITHAKKTLLTHGHVTRRLTYNWCIINTRSAEINSFWPQAFFLALLHNITECLSGGVVCFHLDNTEFVWGFHKQCLLPTFSIHSLCVHVFVELSVLCTLAPLDSIQDFWITFILFLYHLQDRHRWRGSSGYHQCLLSYGYHGWPRYGRTENFQTQILPSPAEPSRGHLEIWQVMDLCYSPSDEFSKNSHLFSVMWLSWEILMHPIDPSTIAILVMRRFVINYAVH